MMRAPRTNMRAFGLLAVASCLTLTIYSPARAQSASSLEQSLKGIEIATSLRLRFDESGKPKEIDRQNLSWYVAETDGPSVPVNAPFYGDCPNGEQPFVYKPWLPPPATSGTENGIEPGYCLQKSKNLIFVLLFEKPISFRKITLFAKGMRLPEWDGKVLSAQLAVISIRAGMKNADLEIRLTN